MFFRAITILKDKRFLAIFFYAAIPIFIWLTLKSFDERFRPVAAIFVSLGQVSALSGLSLFSVSLILSTRLKILDRFFGGINKAYALHHALGGLAFILLLLHPLFLLAQTLPVSFAYSASFILPGFDLAIDLGKYSLSLMILLLVLTFFFRPRYEVWKNSHKLMGLAFLIGGAHSMFVYSDIQSSLALRAYMMLVVFLGFTAYLYRTVFGRWLVRKYEYRLIGKKVENGIIVLTFSAEKKKMAYAAGQFVFINFHSRFLPNETHPFSLSSDPQRIDLELTIKILGDFTAALRDINLGELAFIEGPFGRFNFKNAKAKKQIWIGGGIGVTPFLGMLPELEREENSGYEIDFFYATRTKDEQAVFAGQMEKGRRSRRANLITYISGEQGRIGAEYIKAKARNFSESVIFICGPLGMMRSLKRQFINLKISPSRIISEEFNLLE